MLGRVARQARTKLLAPALSAIGSMREVGPEVQLLLRLHYKHLLYANGPLPALSEVGFSVYSESDEDGILHYIFSVSGEATKKLIDLGAGGIEGSNTANLLINHGWSGLLVDADSEKVQSLRAFYTGARATRIFPPTCICAQLTAENVNAILLDHGYAGEIDLLCIDIDGIDYWIWKAIECVRPRVVLLEYQCIWGADVSVTVPYAPNFHALYEGQFGIYSSASLAAFVKLGVLKGYRLVGCQRYGYNAFFLRNDVARDSLPEVDPDECFTHPFTRWARDTFLEKIQRLQWVEVPDVSTQDD